MEEFVNLRQGIMSALEKSLKFTQLCKYAPSLVSYTRNKMSMFIIEISDHVKKEYHTTMLHDDMKISRLMVYAQFIEDSKLNRNNRELKKSSPNKNGYPRIKKRSPNEDFQVLLMLTKRKVVDHNFLNLLAPCWKEIFWEASSSYWWMLWGLEKMIIK